jgi:hypothetical protein
MEVAKKKYNKKKTQTKNVPEEMEPINPQPPPPQIIIREHPTIEKKFTKLPYITEDCNKNDFLEKIKSMIETMNKPHQIEILKILKEDPTVITTENKSGIFVNLSFLGEPIINQLIDYINYINEQEFCLKTLEVQKDEIKNTFFNEALTGKK